MGDMKEYAVRFDIEVRTDDPVSLVMALRRRLSEAGGQNVRSTTSEKWMVDAMNTRPAPMQSLNGDDILDSPGRRS